MRRFLVIAFLPALAACSTRVPVEDALFIAAPSSPLIVGPGSGQVILLDIDCDGHLDLLTRHLLQNCLTVCLGDGKGGLVPATDSPMRLDYQPAAMALGDVDGDDILDLCVANKDRENEKVDVLLGDSKGGFHRASGSPFVVSAAFELYKPCLRLADVDEDDKLDVVMANGRRNTIEVLRGDGRGGFTPGPGLRLEPGQNLYSFALGDVDGDGHLDLVTASSAGPDDRPGRVITKRGDGSGAFVDLPGSSLSVLAGPALEALADVNGDQRPDLVLSHAHRNLLTILWNDGHGVFAPAPGSPLDVGSQAFDVVVADVNADQSPDLVAATVDAETRPYASSVVVLLGDRSAFVPATGSPFRASLGAYDLAVGNLSEDGRLDVATSSFESDAITLLLGRHPLSRR